MLFKALLVLQMDRYPCPWWYSNEKKDITPFTVGWMLLMFLSLQNSCHFRYVVLYLFLVVVLHEAKIISFADSGMSCVLMCCSIKGMQLALVLGTVDVCCLSLVIVDVDCWMLLVFLLYFEESLGTNSVCSTLVLSVVLLMILFLFLIVSSRLS